MSVVFLVDDDPDDQKFFHLAVSRLGLPVRCEFAYSAIEAIGMLQNLPNFSPDFIFLDINMPMMTGLECLHELKKMEKLRHIPIYMYSTSADETITSSCMILGAAGVIKKVPSVKQLQGLLTAVLVRQR